MRFTTAAALLGLIALTACGKVGPLDRAKPIFGDKPVGATTRDGDKAIERQDPNRPVDTVDPRDRTTDPAPPRTMPIEGTNSNLSRTSPPTAMPDPYANPR